MYRIPDGLDLSPAVGEFTTQVRVGQFDLQFTFGPANIEIKRVVWTTSWLGISVPFADQYEGDPQQWNLYSYARNNPLKYVDPSGRSTHRLGWICRSSV